MDEDFSLLADNVRDFAIILMDTNRRVVRWSMGGEHILGWTEEEAKKQETADFMFTPEDRTAGVPQREQETALREGRAEDERWHLKKDGTRFWASGVMTPLYDKETGTLRGLSKVMRDATERKRLEEELREANERLEARVAERTAELRLFNRELASRVEDERRHVSRELHDQTGQHLVALGVELSQIEQAANAVREAARHSAREASRLAQSAREAATTAETAAITAASDTSPDAARLAAQASDSARAAAISASDARAEAASAAAAMTAVDDAAPRVARLRALVDFLARDLHRIAVDLRPPTLDDLGLVAALQAYAYQCANRAGLTIAVESVGFEERGDPSLRLPAEIETAIYRIVQEALTNIIKHGAGATRVAITLQRIDGHVLAVVEDNGPGFEPQTAGEGRLGLAGMRERAAHLGGTLEVESLPGRGTTIFARLPVQENEL